MKAKERHQLKENEFATTTAHMLTALAENRSRAIAIGLGALVVVALAGGFFLWKRSQADRAGALLGIAIATAQSPIAPPSTLPGATQVPGTFPSLKARSEAALKAFQDVVAQYPSTDAALSANHSAAGELMTLGKFGEAEALFNTVAATSSRVYAPMARLGIAQARFAAGKYDEAVKMFTDLAAERDSTLPVDGVLMQLAQACVKAGKIEDARAAYKRVVDEFADSVYVADARQRLTALS